MKRIIAIISLAITGLSATAQDEFDAVRYGQSDIIGTARYMGMAGAFSSLGGDPSAMTTNPAGLGVYRRSELTLTPSLYINSAKADYDDGSQSENRTRLHINNFAYVMAFPYYTGNQTESSGAFGISFNRLANYYRNFTTGRQNVPYNQTVAAMISDVSQGIYKRAFDANNVWRDPEIGWLSILGYETGLIYPLIDAPDNADYSTGLGDGDTADNEMKYTERGYVNEWAFSYGHNFNNKFYLGITLGIEDLEYERSSNYSEYYYSSGNQELGRFLLNNWMLTTGTGVNVKIGGILRPTENLRLALAFHSPTFYDMTTRQYANASSEFLVDRDVDLTADEYSGSYKTPTDFVTQYTYQSPYKILAGVSYLFGKEGLVSLDYELTDYNAMRLHESNGEEGLFADANHFMSENLKTTHTLKLGAEYRLSNEFSIRGGLANVSRTTEDSAVRVLFKNDVRTDTEYFVDKGTQYASLGFGYRNGGFSFDMAYLLRSNKADFYTSEYDWTPLSIRTNTHNVLATVGYKF